MPPPTHEPLEVTVARIEEVVLRLDRYLLGNGQPGAIQKIEDRIRPLEETRNQWKGAIAIIGFLLMLTGGTLLAHILTH